MYSGVLVKEYRSYGVEIIDNQVAKAIGGLPF